MIDIHVVFGIVQGMRLRQTMSSYHSSMVEWMRYSHVWRNR